MPKGKDRMEAARELPKEVAQAIVNLLKWVPVTIDEKALERSDLCVMVLQTQHTLAGYGTDDGSCKELIWDARTEGSNLSIPVHVPAPETGERMLLRNISRTGVEQFPLQVGDRVFIEMTDARAHQIAREWFERNSRNEKWLEQIKAKFSGRDEVLQHCVNEMRQQGLADVARVTSAMLEDLVIAGLATDAVKEREKLGGQEKANEELIELAKALGQQRADETLQSAVIRGVEAVVNDGAFAHLVQSLLKLLWPDLAASGALAVDVSYFDKNRRKLSGDEWNALQRDYDYAETHRVEVAAKTAPVFMQFAWGWCGLRLELIEHGKVAEVMYVNRSRIRTVNPDGATPWQVKAVFATLEGVGRHYKACQHAVATREWIEGWEAKAKRFHAKIRAQHAEGEQVVDLPGDERVGRNYQPSQEERGYSLEEAIDMVATEIEKRRKGKGRGKA